MLRISNLLLVLSILILPNIGFSQTEPIEQRIIEIDNLIKEAVKAEDYHSAASLKKERDLRVEQKEAVLAEDYKLAAKIAKQIESGGESKETSPLASASKNKSTPTYKGWITLLNEEQGITGVPYAFYLYKGDKIKIIWSSTKDNKGMNIIYTNSTDVNDDYTKIVNDKNSFSEYIYEVENDGMYKFEMRNTWMVKGELTIMRYNEDPEMIAKSNYYTGTMFCRKIKDLSYGVVSVTANLIKREIGEKVISPQENELIDWNRAKHSYKKEISIGDIPTFGSYENGYHHFGLRFYEGDTVKIKFNNINSGDFSMVNIHRELSYQLPLFNWDKSSHLTNGTIVFVVPENNKHYCDYYITGLTGGMFSTNKTLMADINVIPGSYHKEVSECTIVTYELSNWPTYSNGVRPQMRLPSLDEHFK